MQEQNIQCVHDQVLAMLSYLVAVLGSYTALQLAIGIPGIRDSNERTRAVVIAGAVMGGGAIWAMHFIAMLACKMDVAVSYNIGITAFSAAIGMVACMAGLAIAGGSVFTWARLVGGGAFMGLGVAAMHYTGMAAMKMPAILHYNASIVGLSVLIAVVASTAALWLAFNMRGSLQMFGSALVMGVAVCGMHYTGMYAATFQVTADDPVLATAGGISGAYLGAAVFVVTTLLLAGVLVVSILRQQKRASVRI
jgi:NO-binding membrane sensor protein with MHYT domain